MVTDKINYKRITLVTFEHGVDFIPLVEKIMDESPDGTEILEFPESVTPQHPTDLFNSMLKLCKEDKTYLIFTFSAIVFGAFRIGVLQTKQAHDKALYFVRKGDILSVLINEDACCRNWPKGFFDLDLDICDTILGYAYEKRRKEQEVLQEIILSGDYLEECQRLCTEKPPRKVEAIKLYRTVNECSLRDAKSAIEEMFHV